MGRGQAGRRALPAPVAAPTVPTEPVTGSPDGASDWMIVPLFEALQEIVEQINADARALDPHIDRWTRDFGPRRKQETDAQHRARKFQSSASELWGAVLAGRKRALDRRASPAERVRTMAKEVRRQTVVSWAQSIESGRRLLSWPDTSRDDRRRQQIAIEVYTDVSARVEMLLAALGVPAPATPAGR